MKKLDILGSEVTTPDGKGTITALHTKKVLVCLDKIEFKQVMAGIPDNSSTMHYYYDYEDVEDEIEFWLRGQIEELKKQVKNLEFMVENGLGWEDMKNDISMPREL